MRGKFAKSLRRLAEKLAAGASVTEQCLYQENTFNRKREYVRDANGAIQTEEQDGKIRAVTRDISMGTVTVAPNSIRGIYRKLKKAARRVENGSSKAKPVPAEAQAA